MPRCRSRTTKTVMHYRWTGCRRLRWNSKQNEWEKTKKPCMLAWILSPTLGGLLDMRRWYQNGTRSTGTRNSKQSTALWRSESDRPYAPNIMHTLWRFLKSFFPQCHHRVRAQGATRRHNACRQGHNPQHQGDASHNHRVQGVHIVELRSD
jgi:hypothetical protein